MVVIPILHSHCDAPSNFVTVEGLLIRSRPPERMSASWHFAEHFVVKSVPLLKDNYCYVVKCLKTNALAAVDVAVPDPVIAALSKELSKPLDGRSFAILTTHRHADHSGGNRALAQAFPGLEVHGGEKDDIPAVTHPHKDGDTFTVGQLVVNVSHTPCHTKGHVVYHVFHPDDAGAGAVFTGDTMFVGGIGAFFEGDALQMVNALKKIGSLPPQTRVFPGHEYTLNFLKFAKTVEPDNVVLKDWTARFTAERAAGRPAIASTLEAEKQGLNPFMRAAFMVPEFVASQGINDPVKLMQHLYDTCP
jgi:hydroxyacylglutathione hydrolase